MGAVYLRSVIYPLGVALLIPVSSAAYPSLAAATGPAARTAPLPAISLVVATTPPPVTTVLAPSEADRLRRDLTAIAAGSGGRVGISLQELSGPRRTSVSINGGQSFYAASAYKLPLLMAQARQIAAGHGRSLAVHC